MTWSRTGRCIPSARRSSGSTSRNRSYRQAASAPHAPDGGDSESQGRQVVRPDERHRVRQEHDLHRADRRPRPATTAPGAGIQAIVVYPMNALANSQDEELKKFLEKGYPEGRSPVTLRAIHGPGERRRARSDPEQSAGHPADQLHDARAAAHADARIANWSGGAGAALPRLRRAPHLPGSPGSRRGALIRRCRQAFGGHDIICVGTSATMASEGTSEDQKARSREASPKSLFGIAVRRRRKSSAKRWNARRRS